MKTIYRILATTGGLGYGFPMDSFRNAMQQKLDLIAADCGSIDPGPYYLGMGASLQKKANIKRDFKIMLAGALEQGCPVVIGTCGLAGDTPNLLFMVDLAKEAFAELGVRDLKVAVIDGHIDAGVLKAHRDCLIPIGGMALPSDEDMGNCRIVGQMGIAPFMKALDEGAQVILAGRACDVAIYAADPVRRGVDPGLAFHAGHILECGCQACDPSSGSDCLMAEFRDDDSVVFTPPNRACRATTYSIAAHSLYEEDHPTVHFYPEGVLSFEKTEYFEAGERSAGIRNSEFFATSLSVKVEGSRKTGERYISVLPCSPAAAIPEHYHVYGRNGVEQAPMAEGEREMAILIKGTSTDEETAKTLFTLEKGFFMHFGYPERRSTAGNLAFPLSPSEATCRNEKGEFVSFVIAGTRDPLFQANFDRIKSTIAKRMEAEYPDLMRNGKIEVQTGDADAPIMYLETIGPTKEEALARHRAELTAIEPFIDKGREALREVYAGPFFEWAIYHIFNDAASIREKLFPVTLYSAIGGELEVIDTVRPDYRPVGKAGAEKLHPDKMNLAAAVMNGTGAMSHRSPSGKVKPLAQAARVVRSKNAGINKLTYDLFFITGEDYEAALASGLFTTDSVARILDIPAPRIIGVYRADDCLAIKISVHREMVSGSPGDRDIFGAQQHMKLMRLQIPVYENPIRND